MPMRFKDKIEGTITNADYASSAGSVAWGNVSGKPSTLLLRLILIIMLVLVVPVVLLIPQ